MRALKRAARNENPRCWPAAAEICGAAKLSHGELSRVSDKQPAEVQPFVNEVNVLLRQNAANLERARSHVVNLANRVFSPVVAWKRTCWAKWRGRPLAHSGPGWEDALIPLL